ncbi:MAG: ABC transporter ATP-binding protein [Acidobacteria bacterium]|nr:ABC transporter ATP-binding protein [Acidobacteriota bacterium]MCA1640504.1 ABC transporter ATP-binding protein [Acidobacteriota bacterium]
MPAAAPTHEDEAPAGGERGAAMVVRDLTKVYPVQFARLRKFFRRKTTAPVEALRGVSLDVRAGEIFGLIGRNGAGKTTFAKIIATLVQPTSGSVTVRGFDSVKDEGRVRAQVGLASAEERSFYWRLTIEQNLLFFARLYGMGDRAARARIAELVALFELEPLARRRFGQLSTGNKQRVIVARAMMSDPPILLLDEPTRSLDPLAAAEMRATIRKLAAGHEPKTVLLTSHNLAEIEELCDRVAIISRGVIRAVDTPRALRSLHKPTERVRLTLRGKTRDEAVRALSSLALVDFAAHEAGGNVVAEFTREVDDRALDRALGALREVGGEVVSADAERATLLEVLEQYERGHDSESAHGGKD